MEASAVALPVIVSDVPGCRQVVDNGITGLFCKVKDGSDLAKKMEVMIKMPENERQKMGQMGRQKMLDQYDELIVLKHYTQTIADLFNSRNP
jgi:glycosyltransferase involved in cell wall biosynthesis